MKRLPRCLLAIASVWSAAPAQAAVTCEITAVDPFVVYYDALFPNANVSSGTFTVECTRNAAADPTVVAFSATANNGIHAQGQANYANVGASSIGYDVYIDNTATTSWQKAKTIDGTLSLGPGVPATQSVVMTYWTKIPPQQTGLASGAHADSIDVNLDYTATNKGPLTPATRTATLPVQILNLPHCRFSTPPGTVAFNYTAFSPTPVTTSTPFAAVCSTNHPYTVALDQSTTGSVTGVVSGLQYTLSLSATTGIGIGAAQFFTIDGTMPAGQAGDCSTGCSGTNTHTLTITY